MKTPSPRVMVRGKGEVWRRVRVFPPGIHVVASSCCALEAGWLALKRTWAAARAWAAPLVVLPG